MDEALLETAKQLPPEERLKLIGALWDSLEESEITVTAGERAILEARTKDLETNPAAQEPWGDALAWLEARRPR